MPCFSLLNSKAKCTAGLDSSLLSPESTCLRGRSDLCSWGSVARGKHEGSWSGALWQSRQRPCPGLCVQGPGEHSGTPGTEQGVTLTPEQGHSPWWGVRAAKAGCTQSISPKELLWKSPSAQEWSYAGQSNSPAYSTLFRCLVIEQ